MLLKWPRQRLDESPALRCRACPGLSQRRAQSLRRPEPGRSSGANFTIAIPKPWSYHHRDSPRTGFWHYRYRMQPLNPVPRKIDDLCSCAPRITAFSRKARRIPCLSAIRWILHSASVVECWINPTCTYTPVVPARSLCLFDLRSCSLCAWMVSKDVQ